MLSFDVDDTIAAIASPHGEGLRGIIRISGPHCLQCLQRIFWRVDPPGLAPPDRQGLRPTINAEFLAACDRQSQRPFRVVASIDLLPDAPQALWLTGELLVWPSGRSYTRQPSAEFHTLGSQPLLAKCLTRVCQSGARVAQAGEFTLRAFLSGRIDLPQAEAVLSIIDAQADSQLQVALRQLAGGISAPLNQARDQLAWILAEIEAGLDFVEEDIEFLSRPEITRRLEEIEICLTEIVQQIKSRDSGAPVIRVALVGLPNAGKSSLFNELLGAGRAIVSNISGTTTDFLLGNLDLNGIVVELVDTAGWEAPNDNSPNDTHELTPADLAQGQRAAIESRSQIRLLCVDASVAPTAWFRQQLDRLKTSQNADSVTLVVLTKCDLESAETWRSIDPVLRSNLEQERKWIKVQIPASDQLEALKQALRFQVTPLLESQADIVGSTLVRAERSINAAWEAVSRARQTANSGMGEEIVAAEIRGALDEIGTIVGTVYADDILDLVFSRFCIGK